MKRLTLALLFATLFANAQTKETTTLYKGKAIDFKIVKYVENQTDSVIIWYYGYQNKEYSAITDIGSIAFSNQQDLKSFADVLVKLASKPTGSTISIKIDVFDLRRYDFSDEIYIYDDERKYTTITRMQAYQTAIEINKIIYYLKK
jgi:hypothetical protein